MISEFHKNSSQIHIHHLKIYLEPTIVQSLNEKFYTWDSFAFSSIKLNHFFFSTSCLWKSFQKNRNNLHLHDSYHLKFRKKISTWKVCKSWYINRKLLNWIYIYIISTHFNRNACVFFSFCSKKYLFSLFSNSGERKTKRWGRNAIVYAENKWRKIWSYHGFFS